MLATSGGGGDAKTAVTRGSPDGAVCLALHQLDDFTTALRDELKRELGDRTVAVLGDDVDAELLDLLWGAERPSVLVALGHYDDTEPPADDPRIDLGNGRKLNYAGLVDRLDTDDAWAGDPRTLLLLMACSSVATEIAEFGSILGAATSVGAAAVVGTEIPVATSLVSRFTREVTTALWNDPQMTLGRAVLDFRRRLVAHGIPLPFVFSAFGNADLKLRH